MGNQNKYSKGIKFSKAKAENETTEVDTARQMAREFGVIGKFVNTCFIPSASKVADLIHKNELRKLELYGREYLIEQDRKYETRVDDAIQSSKDLFSALVESRVGTAVADFTLVQLQSIVNNKAINVELSAQVKVLNTEKTKACIETEINAVKRQDELNQMLHDIEMSRLKKQLVDTDDVADDVADDVDDRAASFLEDVDGCFKK